MTAKRCYENYHYGTAITIQNKWLHLALHSCNTGHLQNLKAETDARSTFPLDARGLKIQNMCCSPTNKLSRRERERELNSDMLISANVALSVGRRHLLFLILSSLCGYKKQYQYQAESDKRSIIW